MLKNNVLYNEIKDNIIILERRKTMNRYVEFDDNNSELHILNGTESTIKYEDIEKVSVLNEDASFKGKGTPFVHQVLGGTTFYSMFGEPGLYVGLKITLKDGSIKAIYVSEKKCYVNTDMYKKDREIAQKIKNKIDKRII